MTTCAFPACDKPAADNGMCDLHHKVRVSTSWHPSEEQEADW